MVRVGTALNSLGTVAAQQGENERARVLLQENLSVLRELEEEGNPATTLKRFHALNLLGYLAIYDEGDFVRGATLWEESLALVRKAGGTPIESGICFPTSGIQHCCRETTSGRGSPSKRPY